MKILPVLAVIVAMAGLFSAAIASAQTIQTNVTYVCNGERIEIENCNIHDTSDSSTCMVGHPDTILPNGLMKYTYETRGTLKKLLPTCKQPSSQQVAKAQAFNQRIQDQQDAAMKRAEQGNPYAAGEPTAQPAEDPATHAMRRCVAAGRPSSVCLGNGLMDSLMPNVNGLLSSVAPGVVGKEVTGPQMSGVFIGDGQWRLEFSEASVALSCADMRPDSHAYTIAIVDNRAVLTISSSPANIVLYANGDTLTGTGSVTVNGLVSAGVRDGYTYSGKQATIYEYQRVTRTCPRPNLSSKGAGPGVVGTEKNLLEGIFGGQSSPPTPAGLRMNGTYATSTGFSVGFYPESAILGCGPDAARAYPYTVTADGRQAVVKVDAPDHPLTMILQSNNTLNPGSGPYLVEGRRVVGQNDNDDFTFAPLNATCNLAVLSPGDVPSGAVPITAATAAAASAGSASAAGPVSTRLSTPGAPTGNAVLSVLNGFPARAGTQNPLAGHPYVLLRESFTAAISRAGVSVPSGTSVYKVFGTACGQRTPDCQKMMSALNADAAATIRADANGKATFSGVPAGTYYLMISTFYNQQPLFWGQQVNLRAGANSVTLTANSATVMK
jgi:hypothetical protein